jgi:hypothetical protein
MVALAPKGQHSTNRPFTSGTPEACFRLDGPLFVCFRSRLDEEVGAENNEFSTIRRSRLPLLGKYRSANGRKE